jgi:hypothetical protein
VYSHILLSHLGFKKCLANKCQDTVMNRKCCHLGTKLAKRSYSCSVDAVLSTQKYLRSLKHKIHSKTTLPANRLFHKVRQCKRYEDCLHCCCMHHKRYIFSLSKYRKFNYGGWLSYWILLDQKNSNVGVLQLNLIQNIQCLYSWYLLVYIVNICRFIEILILFRNFAKTL